jgi:hypothetical protein
MLILAALVWRQAQSSPFPQIVSGRVVEVEDGPIYSKIVLNPDGSRAYDSMAYYYLLEDGAPQSDDLAFKLGAAGATIWLSVSPTGRFITGSLDQHKDYLLDLEQKSFHDVVFTCESWSRDGLRCIDINGNLFDILGNQKVEKWDNNLDFREAKNVSGNGQYLWDNDRNVPIAHMFGCPQRDALTLEIIETWCQLLPPSVRYSEQKSLGLVDNLVEITMPDSVVGWTFDPTGKYVLLAIWERKPKSYTTYEELVSSENVLDTRLLLVNWHTKRTFELGRLSQFTPDSPIMAYPSINGPQWSADGSTILISLYDHKHLLVLKVKYP